MYSSMAIDKLFLEASDIVSVHVTATNSDVLVRNMNLPEYVLNI